MEVCNLYLQPSTQFAFYVCNVQPKNQTVCRMSSAEEVVLAAAACKRPRRYWVRPSLQARARYSDSDLLNDLNRDDTDPLTGELRCDGSIKNFLRMSSDDFECLIMGIGHIISKQDTNYRKAILVLERLAINLRFLSSGDSYTSLSYLFKVSKSAISLLVPEVCEAVIGFLKDNLQKFGIGNRTVFLKGLRLLDEATGSLPTYSVSFASPM